MLTGAVQPTPLFVFDQYQTSVDVPPTTSSGPSPFTSPTPSAVIAFAGVYAGSALMITPPVVPDPVRIRTVVPKAIATSRPACVVEKFPSFRPTIGDGAV